MSDHTTKRRTLTRDAPDADRLTALIGTVGERLQHRAVELVAAMDAGIVAAIEDLGDSDMIDMLHASVEGNITTILYAVRHDIPLEHLQPITAATEYAVRLAQRGVPAAALRRAYHVGSDDLLAFVFDEIGNLDADADTRLRVLHHLSGWVHSYVDWITRTVLDAYDEERRQVVQRSDTMTFAQVRRVLDDVPGAAGPFAERTGYALEQRHLAATLWISGVNPGADHADTLRQLADDVAAAIAVTVPPLVVAVDRSTAWVWFGVGTGAIDLARTRRVFGEVPGARAAFGRPAAGVGGFRASHAESAAAQSVVAVSHAAQTVLGYGERSVATVAMLLRDVEALAAWVRSVLGGLAHNNGQAAGLRATLGSFLACDGSYQRTAAELNLHRNSVKYRVDRAIAARGAPIDVDRLDVELALEVARLLGDVVLEPSARDERTSP